MGRTIFARIRAADTTSPHTENPFDELKNRVKEQDDKFINIIKDKLPINGDDFINVIKEIESDTGTTYTINTFEEKLEALVDKGLLKKEKTPFFNIYKE